MAEDATANVACSNPMPAGQAAASISHHDSFHGVCHGEQTREGFFHLCSVLPLAVPISRHPQPLKSRSLLIL